MKLAKVIGTVVCEHKLDVFEGIKFMLIQPLDEDLNKSGDAIVAVDTVQAGIGDIVFFESSKEGAKALKNWFNPADAAIIGIVDSVNRS